MNDHAGDTEAPEVIELPDTGEAPAVRAPRLRRLPTVAVVGRPNVGKSTLVNRLAARRQSIVGPMSGLTRDRLDAETTWRGRRFVLVDTGGLLEEAMAPKASDTIGGKVAGQALAAVRGADLVLFVVDALAGATADDLALARRMRGVVPPLVLAANKVDNERTELSIGELWTLGLGEPVPVSGLHGRGTGDLLDRIVDLLPDLDEEGAAEEDEIPSIAIVGKPNVGKSSLFNRLIGQDRSIVHSDPGTTRDAIDTILEYEGRLYRLVDTAGMRRHAKTQGVEIFGASRTRAAISRADVAIVLVDASEGATSQDQRISEAVAEAGLGAVLVLNKWDLVDDEEKREHVEQTVADRLHFLDYAPLVRTSALTGRAVGKILGHVDAVLATRRNRVPTGRVNEILSEVQQQLPPARVRNKNVKVLYATQAETAPPTFVLFATGPLGPTWLRFFERRLRETFDFTGNPVRVIARIRQREPR
ncbi:MAG: ribosome biogenesis GTPase Der [Actinomycetota bacterium]